MPAVPTELGSSSSVASSSYSSLLLSQSSSSQSDIADTGISGMPRGDPAMMSIADSPAPISRAATTSVNAPTSTTQKIKRAMAKRRKGSHDATSLLSIMSSDTDQTSPTTSGWPSSQRHASPPPSSATATGHGRLGNRIVPPKLTMHLFGQRKASPQPQEPVSPFMPPPPVPPKVNISRAAAQDLSLRISPDKSTKLSGLPRASFIPSPSNDAAIEFMRDGVLEKAYERIERIQEHTDPDLEREKEGWRRSDSTVASESTVRAPPVPLGRTQTLPVLQGGGPAMASPPLGSQSLVLARSEISSSQPSTPRTTEPLESNLSNDGTRHAKRRSMSLNYHQPTQHSPMGIELNSPGSATLPATAATARPSHSPSHSENLLVMRSEVPSFTRTRTAVETPLFSNQEAQQPNKQNMKDRLTAWTQRSRSTSNPNVASVSQTSLSSPSMSSLLSSSPSPKGPVNSDGPPSSYTRGRFISTSSTSSTAGFKQTATALSGAAVGFGKKAYERVGRVWGAGGSKSDPGDALRIATHQGEPAAANSKRYPKPSKSPLVQGQSHASSHSQAFAPSAFINGRRTPNVHSGSKSISSLGGSRSSSERENGSHSGRETPSSSQVTPTGPGKTLRPPTRPAGGAVFGKDLWECVRETRATVPGGAMDHAFADRTIPALVLRCAQHLMHWGIQEEGLFRISGRATQITRLRRDFDTGADYDLIDCSPSELDPHAVASVFKAYLRELPEPVLTRALLPHFDAAIAAENTVMDVAANTTSHRSRDFGPGLPSGPRAMPQIRKPPSLSTFAPPNPSAYRASSATLVRSLSELISRLPRENRDLLRTVTELMSATAKQSKQTKMPLSNLLLVFCPSLGMGPTLLRALCDTPGIWDGCQITEQVVVLGPETATGDYDSDDGSDLSVPRQMEKGKQKATVQDDDVDDLESAPPPVDDMSSSGSARSRSPSSPRTLALDSSADGQRNSPGSTNSPSEEDSTASSEESVSRAPGMRLSISYEDPRPTAPVHTPEPSSATTLTSLSSEPPTVSLDSFPLPPPMENGHNISREQHGSPQSSSHQAGNSTYVAPESWQVEVGHKHRSPGVSPEKDLPATPTNDLVIIDSPSTPPKPREHRVRSNTLPLTTQSEPSVAFPTTGSPTAPSPMVQKTQESPIKRFIRHPSLNLLRSAPDKVVGHNTDDEDGDADSEITSPRTRIIKRPSLNLLVGSPSKSDSKDRTDSEGGERAPRRRPSLNLLLGAARMGPTLAPRSPLEADGSSNGSRGGSRGSWSPSSKEASPMISRMPALPPTLSLPLEGSIGAGFGWDDLFGGNENPPSPIDVTRSKHDAEVLQANSKTPPSLVYTTQERRETVRPDVSLNKGGARPREDVLDADKPENGTAGQESDNEAILHCGVVNLASPTHSAGFEDQSHWTHDGSAATEAYVLDMKNKSPPNSSCDSPLESSSGDEPPEIDDERTRLSSPPVIGFAFRQSVSLSTDDWANSVLTAADNDVATKTNI